MQGLAPQQLRQQGSDQRRRIRESNNYHSIMQEQNQEVRTDTTIIVPLVSHYSYHWSCYLSTILTNTTPSQPTLSLGMAGLAKKRASVRRLSIMEMDMAEERERR